MDLVKPGRYTAKVIDYGIGETKDGNPQAAVTFSFQDSESKNRVMTWYGHFTDKTIEKTIDSLLICGLKGNDPRELGKGLEGGALDTNREVSIVVEHDQTQDGKTIAKVRWVNRLGGNAFKRMDQADVFRKLPDLRGQVVDRRKETGIKDETRPALRKVSSESFEPDFEDDIKF